jgi:lysophospholipase L1-like esterase
MKKLFIFMLAVLVVSISSAHKRVLYIGDSITDLGWGNSGGKAIPSAKRNHWDLNHIYGHSFMMLCAVHYQSEYPDSDYQFYNRGIGGNKLCDMAARWKEDALDIHADIVSILIGTNDINAYLDSLKTDSQKTFNYKGWEKTYRSLIDQLKSNNPKVRILVGAPFVAKEGRFCNDSTYTLRLSMINKLDVIVRNIAKDENLIVLPFDEMFMDLESHSPRPAYWIWDGIHPTPAGHQRMANLWIKTATDYHLFD